MTVSRIPNVEGGIQPTIVTAKGDLIAAVANASPGRLGVGSNGSYLVADSTAATGLSWANDFAAGKNKMLNGDFRIWQRGTSFTPTNGSFTADRWQNYFDGSGTKTYSRQAFTPGTAPVAGYESAFFIRLNQSVAGTGATVNEFNQAIEDVRTVAGQTATLSFWAKAATNTTLPSIIFRQVPDSGDGGTVVNTTVASNISLTTSWTRYSYTISVPSLAGKTISTVNANYIQIINNLPLNSTFTIDFWGWQLEAGSVATAFQTATGTIQGELAACQRYFEILDTVTQNDWIGDFYSTTSIYGPIFWKVTKRNTPTLTLPSAGSFTIWNAGAALTPSSVGTDTLTTNGGSIYGITSARTVGTAGRFRLSSNTISVSAEL
jgi:hypothetical protein